MNIINFSIYKNFDKGNKNFKKKFKSLFIKEHRKFKKLASLNKNIPHIKYGLIQLRNKEISYLYLLYQNQKLIHVSSINIGNLCLLDKFFYNFKDNEKFSVIGNTFTLPKFRGRNFYTYALSDQINFIIKKLNIKDIYISSKTRKKLKPFYQNNFKKISTGINITFFKKLSIYYCRFKKLHLNIFFNNIIILALRI